MDALAGHKPSWKPGNTLGAQRGRAPVLFLIALWLVAGCQGAGERGSTAEDTMPLPALSRAAVAHCLPALTVEAADAVELPQALSATGCFVDLASLTPAADLIPYRVASPLFSDGVLKQRYMVVPPGQTIARSPDGAWQFPLGSLLLKTFLVEERPGDPQSRVPIEVRFMVRARDRWQFFSYVWNPAVGDAMQNHEDRTIRLAAGSDGSETITLDLPSRQTCLTCHGGSAGVALGPRTEQLNLPVDYEGGRQNQLSAMAAIGLFAGDLGDPAALPALVAPSDESAPLELRARSYLHGNCAHCHRPDGFTSTALELDLRYGLPLAEARICGEPVHHPIHSHYCALLLDPGDPDNSNIVGRMLDSGIAKMPPVSRSIVDEQGVALVRAWIESITDCP